MLGSSVNFSSFALNSNQRQSINKQQSPKVKLYLQPKYNLSFTMKNFSPDACLAKLHTDSINCELFGLNTNMPQIPKVVSRLSDTVHAFSPSACLRNLQEECTINELFGPYDKSLPLIKQHDKKFRVHPLLEPFLKKYEPYFGKPGNYEFKEVESEFGSEFLLNINGQLPIELENNYLKYMKEKNRKFYKIIQTVKFNNFEDFVIQLLKHKEEYPFIVKTAGSGFKLTQDNSLIVGGRIINDYRYRDLKTNKKLYKFLMKNYSELSKNPIEYNGRKYKVEFIFDGFKASDFNPSIDAPGMEKLNSFSLVGIAVKPIEPILQGNNGISQAACLKTIPLFVGG